VALFDHRIARLDGTPTTLAEQKGKALLLVNVASRCGLTPQCAGLERLHERYAERDFSVVGFPCNQFAGQEPGSAEEIQAFCSTTYDVTFPMYEKIEVNGPGRHPVYRDLVDTADNEGYAGDIRWNFEKFLVSPEGEVVARFNPTIDPDSDELVAAVECLLPA
jgi:glutathione peroxidase